MRVIFMGTPDFAVPALRALIDSAHEVVAVYSQPPRPAGRGMKLTASPVHQLAEAHGIPVYTPEHLKSADAQEQMRAHGADIAVVAAYGLLLPQAVLDAPRLGCINIHPSELPRWRGAAPIQRTLMAGDTHTACCIIQLEAGLDTGPIWLREPYAIAAGMNAGELHDVMAETGARMVLEVLARREVDAGYAPVPQAADGITYAQKITREDRPIDWEKPAALLQAHIEGLSPAPAATATIHGEVVKLFTARAEEGRAGAPPGTALDGQLLIQTGAGALRLLELQRPGKARQTASAFLQGVAVPAGTCLS